MTEARASGSHMVELPKVIFQGGRMWRILPWWHHGLNLAHEECGFSSPLWLSVISFSSTLCLSLAWLVTTRVLILNICHCFYYIQPTDPEDLRVTQLISLYHSFSVHFIFDIHPQSTTETWNIHLLCKRNTAIRSDTCSYPEVGGWGKAWTLLRLIQGHNWTYSDVYGSATEDGHA